MHAKKVFENQNVLRIFKSESHLNQAIKSLARINIRPHNHNNHLWRHKATQIISTLHVHDDSNNIAKHVVSNLLTTTPPYQLLRTRLWCNHQMELLLICWPQGYQSQIHDHAQNGCVFRILYGSIQENRYLVHLSSTSFSSSSLSSMEHNQQQPNTTFATFAETKTCTASTTCYQIDNSTHVHSMLSTRPSVSLHVYSPPMYQCLTNYKV